MIICHHYPIHLKEMFKVAEGKKHSLLGGGPDLSQSSITPPEPAIEPPKTEPAPITETTRPKRPQEILAERQKETTSIYHKLMDDMEASVPENGQFFFKLGNKMPEVDNRVIILNEGRKTADGKFEYGTVTDKGAMKLVLDTELYQSTVIKNCSQFRMGYYNDGDNTYRLDFNFSRSDSQLTLWPIGDEDQGFLGEAMAKSIEKSRATSENAKMKAALEAEQKKQTAAKGLSELFNKAIQPPASESPAAPPPTPTV